MVTVLLYQVGVNNNVLREMKPINSLKLTAFATLNHQDFCLEGRRIMCHRLMASELEHVRGLIMVNVGLAIMVDTKYTAPTVQPIFVPLVRIGITLGSSVLHRWVLLYPCPFYTYP